ncbi:hypothetical protein DFQ27_004025 [Actinomortierella ambigua]|uniref:Ubiquitin-like domain-containing protein n=1 Tax=Actinomortierella ambigua TaxID=1343610 RepID=A0A9P6Q309_9FUNG|nr:hypothetical protein DFQ26_006082 [Actinomortierella ambigua]KAG0259511.1 hypothetical protein DFQ27_004025 [Actinomortierella ambigua]
MRVRFHLEEEPRAVYTFTTSDPQTSVAHIRNCIASILYVLPGDVTLLYRDSEMLDSEMVESFDWSDAGDSIRAKVTSYMAGCRTRPFYCHLSTFCARGQLFSRDQLKNTVELQFAPS